jgi:Na+-driven multidrug efflux pump
VAASLVPFVGQNLGQGRFDRIRAALRGGQVFALIWGGLSYAGLALAAWPLARIFSNDDVVLGPAVQFLRIVPIGMAVIGPGILTGSMLNGLHRPLWSSALRIVHVTSLVALAWIGRDGWGYTGMLFGIVAADVIVASVGVACGWMILSRRERLFVLPERPDLLPPRVPPEEPEATASWD